MKNQETLSTIIDLVETGDVDALMSQSGRIPNFKNHIDRKPSNPLSSFPSISL